jgi:mono/diheme cytochrome c family protein
MRMRVRAVAAGSWERELATLSQDGKTQFEAACAKCHNIDGPQLIGPSLTGNPTLADFEALAELVRNGRNEMPPVGRGWSDEQVRTLLEYTRSVAGTGDDG